MSPKETQRGIFLDTASRWHRTISDSLETCRLDVHMITLARSYQRSHAYLPGLTFSNSRFTRNFFSRSLEGHFIQSDRSNLSAAKQFEAKGKVIRRHRFVRKKYRNAIQSTNNQIDRQTLEPQRVFLLMDSLPAVFYATDGVLSRARKKKEKKMNGPNNGRFSATPRR